MLYEVITMAKKAVNKKNASADFSKYIRWFWKLFVGGILAIILVFLFASWGLFGEMPATEDLQNPKTNLASQIISSDGKLIAKFYLDDNRTPVTYDQLPQNLVDSYNFV